VQKKLDQEAMNAIVGLAVCPSCEKILILDTTNNKNRILACNCQSKYVVIRFAAGGLLPLDSFGQLGKCTCGMLVELVGTETDINCPSCKKRTVWEPLTKEAKK
jgi:DNA-directed RNA polymerase subunit RPC12/RpoP